MKILFDTGFLYSAIFHPNPRFDAIISFVFTNHIPYIPRYVANELINKGRLKRPESLPAVYEFLAAMEDSIAEQSDPVEGTPVIQDPKDQPILDAAIAIDVDIIIASDKHFLRLDIDRPRIMKPADFIAEFMESRQ